MSTNPFSPDYKPQIDLKDIVRDGRISQIRTQQRREGLASDDPERRRTASGTIEGMGATKEDKPKKGKKK